MHFSLRDIFGSVRRLTVMLSALAALAGCTTTSVLAPSVSVAPLVSEKYSAIVVDGGSGKVLYENASDELRYPASLTKLMTLYLLFEALDSGRIVPPSQIPISAYAASQPPSKIGLKTGESIDVATAILALCVKSGNDIAVAVGEYLAGSEEQFAAMMTAKARQLGMHSTTFRNASGLPDPGQVTTARDMVVLAMALHRHFPHHYHFFSNRSFTYAGRTIRGHNDLLGRVDGVDGLKTGYIRASGYNLATSIGRHGKRVFAIVMGGKTAKARDAHMEELIEAYLPQARRI